jgi:hypothetical protein
MFSSKQRFNCTHEVEWTPFQTHYFSENLVAPGIEPGSMDLSPGTLTIRPLRRYVLNNNIYKVIKKQRQFNKAKLHY